jgi:hypothetical protein
MGLRPYSPDPGGASLSDVLRKTGGRQLKTCQNSNLHFAIRLATTSAETSPMWWWRATTWPINTGTGLIPELLSVPAGGLCRRRIAVLHLRTHRLGRLGCQGSFMAGGFGHLSLCRRQLLRLISLGTRLVSRL